MVCEILQELLTASADANVADMSGQTALGLARKYEQPLMNEQLVAVGASDPDNNYIFV